VVALTALKDSKIAFDQVRPLFKSLSKGSLKTVFVLVKSLISAGVSGDQHQERARQLLQLVKEEMQNEFSQSTIYLLKQLSDDPALKDKVLNLLASDPSSESIDERAESKLVARFGDKEYSILSALSSQRRQTSLAALEAVQEKSFVDSLSPNEQALVKLVLLQLLNSGKNEEEQLNHILAALNHLHPVGGASHVDIDF